MIIVLAEVERSTNIVMENRSVYSLSFLEKNKDIFNSIKDGKKKIETRAGKSEYSKIKSGDVIELSCGEENFLKTVGKAFQLKSLESLFEKYKPEEIIPGIFSYEKIKEIYLSFPNYEKRIKENGIFVFELE